MDSALHILNIDEKNDARTELDQHDAMLVALRCTQHTDWCVVRGGTVKWRYMLIDTVCHM